MYAGGLAVRRSCSAQNAYNSSYALYSTFRSQLNYIHTLNDINHESGRHPRAHPNRPNVDQQALPFFSSRAYTKQVFLQAASTVETRLDEDRRRLAPQGGTYGNYEHLRNSLGRDESVQQAAKEVKTESGRLSNLRIRKLRWQGTPRQDRRYQEVAQTQTKANAKKRPYSWQAHMRKIANEAGILSGTPLDLSDTATIQARREQLGYLGRYIETEEPEISPVDSHMPIPWAVDLSEMSGKPAGELLEREIQHFADYMEPTAEEKVAREAVASELTKFIAKHAGSDVTAELFGSERTGLALATSDIDIRLDCDIEHKGRKVQYLIERMKDLTSIMGESEEYILVVSRWVRYPIINAQHKRTGIHIQIVAAPSSAPQDAATLQYMSELPHLRALYVLMRATLGTRGLVDVFNGGTGSYGLFMMLVASIKRRSTPPPVTMTEQLFRFLEFYSKLNTDKYGVSVSPPGLFKKHDPVDVPTKPFVEAARRRGDVVRSGQWAISQRRIYQPYLLCLQDPANPVNDLGRKSNAIKHINTTLKGILADLKVDMQRAAERAAGRKRGEGLSILLRLVGMCHEVYYERRKKVEEYGMEVMASRKRAIESGSKVRTPPLEVPEAVA